MSHASAPAAAASTNQRNASPTADEELRSEQAFRRRRVHARLDQARAVVRPLEPCEALAEPASLSSRRSRRCGHGGRDPPRWCVGSAPAKPYAPICSMVSVDGPAGFVSARRTIVTAIASRKSPMMSTRLIMASELDRDDSSDDVEPEDHHHDRGPRTRPDPASCGRGDPGETGSRGAGRRGSRPGRAR